MLSFRTARIGGLCAAVCAVLLLVQMRVQGNQLPEDTVMIVDSPPSAEFEIPAQATPAAAATVNAALAPAAATPDAEPAELSEWDRRWWIDKASRILRGGAGVSPFDEMSELNGLPEEEIAKRFMEDPRFVETVLDFNLFFLGYKVDQLKTDGAYVFEAYDFASAVNAAKAVANNGDYLTLFELEGDYYLPPLSQSPTEDEKSEEDEKLSPDKLRQKAAGELAEHLEGLIELVDNPTPAPVSELCEEAEEILEVQTDIEAAFLRAFTDQEIFVLDRAKLPSFLFDELQRIVDQDCEAGSGGSKESDSIENAVWAINGKLETALQEIFKFEPAVYNPASILEFKPLDRAALPASQPWPVFGYTQSIVLANSSTNFNRKRAAYTLKRFFCDDLTPVGFDMPQEHVAGSHGSQTSCFSCHYKLDPMAGFFRNYGGRFADMTGEAEIIFDDSATKPRTDYLKGWRGPESPDGTWEIGYIRSARWKDENDYGHNLSDLTRIIRNAPEAKRCLMKRLTQYVLGENQTVDGGYLDGLTADFERESKVNSSHAFKNAMVSVLTSKTFRERNPDPLNCYDLAAGTLAGDRPPCRIAYILEKNCVQCHNSEMTQNQLDLTVWNTGGAGMPNFRHFDASGDSVGAADTLGAVADRLSTSDPHKRMPKNVTMSSQERQELYLWTQEELSGNAVQR